MSGTESIDRRGIIIGMNSTLAVGVREIRRFIADFGALECALDRTAAELMPPDRWPEALVRAIRAGEIPSRAAAARERSRTAAIAIDTFEDDAYPLRLQTLDNPPAVLFRRGAPLPRDVRAVAIVGSRRCSSYGVRAARSIAGDLGRRGVLVISGLARGIDTAAHWGAVDAGGRTAAVMGSGHAYLYPPENEELVARMLALEGATLSEFSPDVPPLAHHFPRRNRILAALADALLVVEAQEKSGALITTRWAADLGKDVFVLPGQIDNPACAGSLALLRDGARLVRGADDILADMDWGGADESSGESGGDAPTVDPKERALLAMLDHEPTPLDDLVNAAIDPPGEILTRLLSLELRELVEQSPGMLFRRTELGTRVIARERTP